MGDGNEPQAVPARAERPAKDNRGRLLLIWGVVGFVLLAILAGSMVYTEQSSFCPTCHEMRPYYTAWQGGGHATHARCVDCHVDSGVIAHLAHKPIALKEVWDHFFKDNRFPNYTVEVPNSRCLGCHPKVAMKSGSTFSHSLHANKARCQECHATTGHIVTLASLQAEGVLKAAATTPPVPADLKPSSITGHIVVVCQKCHDQTNMKCSQCHQAPHEARGECSNCHVPGTKFGFFHGASGTDCSQCHNPPANHFAGNCSSCHTPGVPFKDTVFTHPRRIGEHNYRSFPCVKCHPSGTATSSCTCHGGKAPSGD